MEKGRRIGKYVLDERIAVGGMAEVWAARAEGREGFVKPVALKFILESFSGDPELERLFVNEARIAARLQHANLVTVFDFDKVDPDQERGLAGRYYIAMERVEGHDLRRLSEAARRAGRVFPLGVALYVAGEVLKALRYVHERREAGVALGLVHRDVSPHNVLVGYAGEVKLSDFGIAKAREHSARTTKPGSLRGKIAYASPEQLSGGFIDHRTDQFAAGVTLWEIFAGRRLFDGSSDLEIIGKVARCAIPPLDARLDVPSAVEAVVRRMLSSDPAARFATTADALSAVLALPGYTPDGTALGELMRALLPSDGGERSPARESPSALVAETLTMHAGAPAAPRAGGGTPRRQATRASEALARSPAAAGVAPTSGTTVDLRRRGVARTVAVMVVGLALGGAALARHELAVPASPSATPIAVAPLAPPPVAAFAPRVAPPPTAASPRAVPDLAPAPTGVATPQPAAVARDASASERHRASRRHRAASSDDAPVVAAPPRAPAPSLKSSSNGAPIIE